MSNVKATKKSKKNSVKKLNQHDIPVNQKHQIISVKEFGDYNYDTRRKQWHQKAGHNDHKVVCAICKDDDNWATIEVNNGAHICYFCWVKKPTAETKKIVASVKKESLKPLTTKNKSENRLVINKRSNRNMYTTNNFDDYASDVEIVKFCDDKGVTYRNVDEIQNYKTDKNTIDKTSKYGVCPSVFYDSTVVYKKPHDKICVVRPYDNNYLVRAARLVQQYADNKSREAINQYNNDVLRAKLLTKRNMVAAKVDSLRILTKAILLEKNEYEQENEKNRHIRAIENIKLLREQKLEKNKIDLANNINNINARHDHEVKRNEDELIKARVRLEQQMEINDLKIERQKDKIRILSRGEDYTRKSIREELKSIKNRKAIPGQFDLSSNDNSVAALVERFKEMDPNSLTQEERDVVVKFLRLIESYDKEEKYAELSAQYRDAISAMNRKIARTAHKASKKNPNENEYMIVSYNTYKKIVNAKKETMVISMPVKQLQQQTITVKTKTIKVKKPDGALKPVTTNQALVKIKPQRMNFEKMDYQKIDPLDAYYTKDIQRTIDKFRRIVRNTFKSSGFDVTPYGPNAYKINYQKMTYTKYQLKYKKTWRDIFGSKKSYPSEFDSSDPRYVSLEEFNKGSTNWFSNLFKPKLNDYGEPVAKHLNKLRRLIETLPSDPVIMQNNGLFQQERVDLSNAIAQLRKLDIDHNWNQKQVDETLAEVNRILDLYHEIARADTKYYRNIHQAQIEDEKLIRNINYYERSIVNGFAAADSRYNEKCNQIKNRYLRNLENAENQSLLNVEYIYEQEQAGLNKEDQQHLWNQSSLYSKNNKLANNQYKFQNSLINSLVSEVERYNKKTNTPISLMPVPAKINKLPVTSNEALNLTFDQIGDNVIVHAQSNQKRKELLAKAVNKKVPEDVQVVYVLDKYRNIPDLKTRVALLTEYAQTSYDNALKQNKQREAKEIAIAYEILEKKLAEVDTIYIDAEKLRFAGERLNHLVQERKWVQDNYVHLKNEKWKIHDKNEYYKQRIEQLKEREEQKELMLLQKQQNKYEKQKNKIIKKQNKQLDYHEVIQNK